MKLPERGPCRRGPWKGNVKSAATLVEGLVDRFSDASSTLDASTKRVLGEHILFRRRVRREMFALIPNKKAPS